MDHLDYFDMEILLTPANLAKLREDHPDLGSKLDELSFYFTEDPDRSSGLHELLHYDDYDVAYGEVFEWPDTFDRLCPYLEEGASLEFQLESRPGELFALLFGATRCTLRKAETFYTEEAMVRHLLQHFKGHQTLDEILRGLELTSQVSGG